MIQKTKPEAWRDLQVDQLAWLKARSEFPDAPISVVATRAQQIKEAEADHAESRQDEKDRLRTDNGT